MDNEHDASDELAEWLRPVPPEKMHPALLGHCRDWARTVPSLTPPLAEAREQLQQGLQRGSDAADLVLMLIDLACAELASSGRRERLSAWESAREAGRILKGHRSAFSRRAQAYYGVRLAWLRAQCRLARGILPTYREMDWSDRHLCRIRDLSLPAAIVHHVNIAAHRNKGQSLEAPLELMDRLLIFMDMDDEGLPNFLRSLWDDARAEEATQRQERLSSFVRCLQQCAIRPS